jgi:hypothetical protein
MLIYSVAKLEANRSGTLVLTQENKPTSNMTANRIARAKISFPSLVDWSD